jgi:hypothetical protein
MKAKRRRGRWVRYVRHAGRFVDSLCATIHYGVRQPLAMAAGYPWETRKRRYRITVEEWIPAKGAKR